MSEDAGLTWHGEVISASTEATLGVLRDGGVLDGFYLAGGTGLALQVGHRVSLDLDFFSTESLNEDVLIQRVQNFAGFSLTAKAPQTIHATIQETKVSFLGYRYPVLYPLVSFAGVAVADARDIACMKLSAIASRGAKRDFVDLYFSAKRFGLDELMRLFEIKYAAAKMSEIHLFKSLVYFADAEKDPMPHMLSDADWNAVKLFFVSQVSRLRR